MSEYPELSTRLERLALHNMAVRNRLRKTKTAQWVALLETCCTKWDQYPTTAHRPADMLEWLRKQGIKV